MIASKMMPPTNPIDCVCAVVGLVTSTFWLSPSAAPTPVTRATRSTAVPEAVSHPKKQLPNLIPPKPSFARPPTSRRSTVAVLSVTAGSLRVTGPSSRLLFRSASGVLTALLIKPSFGGGTQPPPLETLTQRLHEESRRPAVPARRFLTVRRSSTRVGHSVSFSHEDHLDSRTQTPAAKAVSRQSLRSADGDFPRDCAPNGVSGPPR